MTDKGNRRKKRTVVAPAAPPAAYVMPKPPEPEPFSLDNLADISERGMRRFVNSVVASFRRTDSNEEIEPVEYVDDDDPTDYVVDEPTTAAISLGAQGHVDGLQTQVDTPAPVMLTGVNNDAITLLLIHVLSEVRSWKKRPKDKAMEKAILAAAVSAVAKVRGEFGAKDARGQAKDAGVRYQRFLKIRGIALKKINELGILDDLLR